MKNTLFGNYILALLITFSCSHEIPIVTFNEDSVNKKIEVIVNERLFTIYQWRDDVFKPMLYPIYTSAGTEITRGYPIRPRDGERTDHNHQIGLYLSYRDVDGYNFWGNGSRGLGIKNEDGGIIKHLSVEKLSEGEEGLIVTIESWVDPTGKELLKENTEYYFLVDGDTRIIDRITILTATDKEVSMNDKKDGLFAIRVAKQLELPLKGVSTFDTETVKELSDKTSGNYLSSEGITGLDVWGTRARWMNLFGVIDNEKISIVICDHPKNPCYPTYWHAREYGLFAANPLGWKDFTDGKQQLNFKISVNESVTFRYRIIISSGIHLNSETINAYADNFADKY